MATRSLTIIVRGPQAEKAGALLKNRLKETEHAHCDFEVVAHENDACDTAETLVFSLNRHDTPPFAVEKILDDLGARGLVRLEDGMLSDEEEEQIRARLQGLGYLE